MTGQWVYKLKKPVSFGFLNFEELDARRLFCEREVFLNQRLSRNVYEGVIGITREADGRFSLGGRGVPVEYAVKMKELPDSACLTSLLAAGRVSEEEMEALGRHLAGFYEGSVRSVDIDHFGHPEVIALNMEENFRQVEPFVGEFLPGEEWDFVRQASRSFFVYRRSLFERRIREGFIRDGHGDLRAEHVYLVDGIQIIDCIEFNDRFRYGDVVSDLAFLHMDLEHLGHAPSSEVILAAYAEKAKDPSLYALLDFYAAYRAAVRVKVACLRSTEVESEAERKQLRTVASDFAGHAYHYAVQFSRPMLWVFCGLPASESLLLPNPLRTPWTYRSYNRTGSEKVGCGSAIAGRALQLLTREVTKRSSGITFIRKCSDSRMNISSPADRLSWMVHIRRRGGELRSSGWQTISTAASFLWNALLKWRP